MELIYDPESVQIHHGLRLVTIHRRDDTPYAYTIKEAHGLPGHHGSYEKDMEEIYRRASETDNILLLYLKEVAGMKKYPQKAFRSCRAIMSLEKKHGMARLVAACACASEGRLYGYNEVKGILERGDDAPYMETGEGLAASPGDSTPQIHGNIRGREYYSSPSSKSNPKCLSLK